MRLKRARQITINECFGEREAGKGKQQIQDQLSGTIKFCASKFLTECPVSAILQDVSNGVMKTATLRDGEKVAGPVKGMKRLPPSLWLLSGMQR